MDINNFGPFNANVWGTFSDWVMVVVTAVTAYYLFRTLKSQMIVQELQQRTFEIENTNNISNILPIFKAEIDRKPLETSEKGETHMLRITFQIINQQTAKNIKLVSEKKFSFSKNSFKTIMYPNDKIISFLYYTPSSSPLQFLTYPWKCRLEFTDIRGHRYQQYISVVKAQAKHNAHMQSPERLDE